MRAADARRRASSGSASSKPARRAKPISNAPSRYVEETGAISETMARARHYADRAASALATAARRAKSARPWPTSPISASSGRTNHPHPLAGRCARSATVRVAASPLRSTSPAMRRMRRIRVARTHQLGCAARSGGRSVHPLALSNKPKHVAPLPRMRARSDAGHARQLAEHVADHRRDRDAPALPDRSLSSRRKQRASQRVSADRSSPCRAASVSARNTSAVGTATPGLTSTIGRRGTLGDGRERSRRGLPSRRACSAGTPARRSRAWPRSRSEIGRVSRH